MLIECFFCQGIKFLRILDPLFMPNFATVVHRIEAQKNILVCLRCKLCFVVDVILDTPKMNNERLSSVGRSDDRGESRQIHGSIAQITSIWSWSLSTQIRNFGVLNALISTFSVLIFSSTQQCYNIRVKKSPDSSSVLFIAERIIIDRLTVIHTVRVRNIAKASSRRRTFWVSRRDPVDPSSTRR